ncbi:ribonuclease HI family protein [Patescibacteria group bacterium]|nr:ribonuclease HI family protein [Patescibacteria group bacterium]
MSTLVVHTDGGARGNPGPAAAGVVILLNGQLILEAGKYLGVQTNNEAEYQAVLHALTLLPDVLKKHEVNQIEWRLDSMLVVQQLSRQWKIKESRLAVFAQQIWQQLSALSAPSTFKYVPRAENAAADAMVNKILDLEAKK